MAKKNYTKKSHRLNRKEARAKNKGVDMAYKNAIHAYISGLYDESAFDALPEFQPVRRNR